jgi:uncharacterized membrane protein (DUF485 family)
MKEKILNSEEFKHLVKTKKIVSFLLTLIEIIIYFGFIFLIAYKKAFLSQKIWGDINIGITLGIVIILVSWILTGIYIIWANKIYDAKIALIKEKIEEGE